MMARKRSLLIAGALLLAGCGGLPRPLRQEIASENEKLKQADRQLNRSMKTIGDDLAHAPDLFQGTSAAADWHARIRSAQSKLDSAKSDSRELEKMQGSGGKEAVTRAEPRLTNIHPSSPSKRTPLGSLWSIMTVTPLAYFISTW